MDDPRWLRVITIGLVLAALAVGYFLLSGKLSSNSSTRVQSQTSKITQSPTPTSVIPSVVNSSPSAIIVQNIPNPSPTQIPASTPIPSSIPTSANAFTRIANRTPIQNQVKILPRTGFPLGLAMVFSISAIISGLGLRKFPH